jgi:arginyl-tRNA synthetase
MRVPSSALRVAYCYCCGEQIYERLGVRVHERGESTYAAAVPAVLRELSDAGLTAESEGALVVQVSLAFFASRRRCFSTLALRLSALLP